MTKGMNESKKGRKGEKKQGENEGRVKMWKNETKKEGNKIVTKKDETKN
jgi:hypothetical protein